MNKETWREGWQRSTKSSPTERKPRGCGWWTKTRAWRRRRWMFVNSGRSEHSDGGVAGGEGESEQRRPTSRRPSVLKKTFNPQDQNVRRKSKSSCAPHLGSETPPSIHLLNPVLKSHNWIKLILMFCLFELKTLSANYPPCLVSCNYINLFPPFSDEYKGNYPSMSSI